MTLYTVMPLEFVWEQREEASPTQEMQIQGVLMEVKTLENNRVEIVRLLNGPLDCYLNPAFAPGEIIRFVPVM
ncbi:YlzJ-like family protein [Paenibacillus azoreducens]|uniref:YlzJ-like family protein n=1 Tax=Paenibacillus azoreducens TaxID=116718 RepID=UPI0039F61D34